MSIVNTMDRRQAAKGTNRVEILQRRVNHEMRYIFICEDLPQYYTEVEQSKCGVCIYNSVTFLLEGQNSILRFDEKLVTHRTPSIS